MAKDDGARPAPARRARSSEDSPRSAGKERTNGGPEGGPSAAEERGPVAAADGLAPVGAAEERGPSPPPTGSLRSARPRGRVSPTPPSSGPFPTALRTGTA